MVYRERLDEDRGDLLPFLLPLTRELRRIEEAAAAQEGLSMWQYAILSVVARRAGLHQAAVSKVLGYSQNRLVKDLDQLEHDGLVTRQQAADRRANIVHITPAGRRAMRAIQTEIHGHEDELMAGLSASARRTFVTALARVDEQVRLRR